MFPTKKIAAFKDKIPRNNIFRYEMGSGWQNFQQ